MKHFPVSASVLLLLKAMTALTLKERKFLQLTSHSLRATYVMPRWKRCTFMIEWLHQELKGQTVTLPSSSIMKLASKSIIVHPTVAAFLKSVKQMGPNSASPFPVVHEEFGFELDLNKLLEKQIEEINISTNGFRKEITENILEGVKADNKGHILLNPVTASKICISDAQVSHDQDQSKSTAQSSIEYEVNIDDEGLQAPRSSMQEEHSEYKSRLSPLGARAALALLVSSSHKHIAIGGTELFKSCDSDNMFTKDTKAHKNENKTSDATKTSSVVQRGFEIQNSDTHLRNSAEEIKPRALTSARRLTRSAIQQEKYKLTVTVEQGLDESKSAHAAGSFSSVGNATIHESNVLKEKNDVSKKKKVVSSPFHAESNIPMEERDKKLMSGDAGAIQDICDPIKTCGKESKNTKSAVTTNMRRSTRLTCSSEENGTVPENHGKEEKSGGPRKKTAVSPSAGKDKNMHGEESNEKHMSGAVTRSGNTRQIEGKVSGSGGKSQGQKRKSASSSKQELRFSPRLKFLPQTRSQKKS
ncbi:uncharacterized protein [Pyrus communis]|uniref:uncharacterized protein isoform X3 n=1 Tax=Pyrus communis TaxID=23211 RepID=UPI0035C0BD90